MPDFALVFREDDRVKSYFLKNWENQIKKALPKW